MAIKYICDICGQETSEEHNTFIFEKHTPSNPIANPPVRVKLFYQYKKDGDWEEDGQICKDCVIKIVTEGKLVNRTK